MASCMLGRIECVTKRSLSWVFRCNEVGGVAELAQAARVRILHLSRRASGPRCALGVKELSCDLFVEPQPIGGVRCAGTASRASLRLDSRAAPMGCSASAGLVTDSWHSGKPLSPTRAPHCDVPEALGSPSSTDGLAGQPASRRRADVLVGAGTSSTTRRTTIYQMASSASAACMFELTRQRWCCGTACCAMAAERSGSGRQARAWPSQCAQRLQGSTWVAGPAAGRVGPAGDATGGVRVRECA